MKKMFVLSAVVASSVFFLACEEEAIPVPLPPPPPSGQFTDELPALPPPDNTMPETAKQAAPAAPPPAPAAKTVATPPPPASSPTFATAVSEVALGAEQSKSGRYTIQVAVFPSEVSAKKLVKKMSNNGIKSYYAKVNNPAQLLGTYYRVRVGYFSGKTVAENFAKSRLEPLGYAWYVDGSRNDTVGNPAVPSAPVAQSNPAVPSDPDLEKAKKEYKEIAKQAEAAKQANPKNIKQAPPLPATK